MAGAYIAGARLADTRHWQTEPHRLCGWLAAGAKNFALENKHDIQSLQHSLLREKNIIYL